LASTVEEDESLERLLIQLLCNLSGFKNNQQKLAVEEGAIRIIARAADRTTSVNVVRLCASTLCNFAGEGRARPKMADSRTAQALLDLTKHEDVGVRREVAHTVARLAADASCREKILQFGIISTLVTMTKANDLDIATGRCVALAFRVLSSNLKFAAIIVDDGAVDALIALTRSTDTACRLSCAQSLCNLIRFAIRLDYLIECGVVSALVRLADPGDEATSECCAAALYLFFCHPDVLALIDGREVIRALMDLCRVGTTSIRKRCVAAIWNMTNVEQVVHGGGSAAESIPMLLGLLQTESDKGLKADCGAALYNLARNQDNCQAMIVSGAVPPIMVLASSGSFETKTQCMSILQRMLLGRAMPEEIMTKSFVRTLLDISRMEHRDTQQRVVIAVYRISCCTRGRELLLEEGAPESLIRLISKPNEEMRKGCANTLLNLASDPGREIEITKCGAVSVLLITALVASDSDETRHACTKAMTNLLCEKQAHRGMFKDGVVWGLATMSKSTDITIARLCSVALCNLSCEYWKDIAMSNCMQAVYGLARSDDAAAMSAGMKALHNVLLRAQHLEGVDHIFSCTVPIARRALLHESEDVRLVGLRLTNLVSTTSGARQAAIRYGVLDCIAVNDFNRNEPLSFSFCCALEKFALDPTTRGAVLDSGCTANFPALCALSDRIFASLARFMYSVSCSPELVRRLVFEHDCLKVASAFEPRPVCEEEDEGGVKIERIGSVDVSDGGGGRGGDDSQKGSLDGARETCAILLFNLSTQDEVKTELVLKGGTRLAFILWEKGSPAVRRDCSLVACNLALGKASPVNTAKMVRHGAGQLLVELVTNTDSLKDADGNHIQLAEEGVIPALIDLAKTDCPVVRRNCASAMRSMTCKADVRQLLIVSGAIKVILDDATSQDADETLAIDNELLCEIEAESWVNGTRGILVESRAPGLPTLGQNSSLLPVREDNHSTKAAKVAAALALNEEGEGALYRMPWQKLQALDVDLREPDMEISAKQDGAKRFDDPGIAAALAGDAEADGPGGLLLSAAVNCGKLEPKPSAGVRLGHSEESFEGDRSLCSSSNNNSSLASTGSTDNAHQSGSGDSYSSGGTRFAQQSSSLTTTLEEGGEGSDESDVSSNSNDTVTEETGSGSRRAAAKVRRRRPPRSSLEYEGTSTGSDSESDVHKNGGVDGAARKERNGAQLIVKHNQRGEIEGIPDPSIVDWEVAVVMAATSADDMVEKYIMTRKENHPGRRGSVNISSIGSRRQSSALGPNSANAIALLTSPRSALPATAMRRGSVQPVGHSGSRRPSNFLRQQHSATPERHSVNICVGAGAGTSSQVTKASGQQQPQQLGRQSSVSHRPSPAVVAGRRTSVLHAIGAKASGTAVTAGSISCSSKSKSAVDSGGLGGAGTGVAAGLTAAKKERNSSGMGKSPLATTEEAMGDNTADDGGATRTDALRLATVEVLRDKIGPFAPQREDTFDAAAGRFPLHNL
ncbi:unnamed protein product, partial [Hapterophycus canaliculatus]